MDNPIRTRLQVETEEVTLICLAPELEDITATVEIITQGEGENKLADHLALFVKAREILLPLIVGVERDGEEVPDWREWISTSGLTAGFQAIAILQALCFRGAGKVEVVNPK